MIRSILVASAICPSFSGQLKIHTHQNCPAIQGASLHFFNWVYHLVIISFIRIFACV